MKKRSETSIVKSILDYLALHHIWAFKCNSGQTMGSYKGRSWVIRLAPTGTPDILGYLPGGKLLAIEVKRPGKKRSPEQIEWAQRAINHGVFYILATSIDDVDAMLHPKAVTV